MNNLKASLLGYITSWSSFVLMGWGDMLKAFIVGFAGAVGGILANLIWKLIKKLYENKKK